MKAQVIKELKIQLQAKRAVLVNRVEALKADKTREGGAISQDFEEQAVDVENDEVIDHLEVLELKEIEQIDLAMRKIEGGHFGICAECDAEILPARLKALPFSALCIKCASED